VAYAFIQEFNASGDDRSTANYDAVSARIDIASSPPAGLIVHTAGWDEDNGVFRIFDVWESRADADRFWQERLQPVLDELMPQAENATAPDSEGRYELHDVSAR
jgi:hypothetical protein